MCLGLGCEAGVSWDCVAAVTVGCDGGRMLVVWRWRLTEISNDGDRFCLVVGFCRRVSRRRQASAAAVAGFGGGGG